jgi:nitrite reductase/ring-hydroxylating ferredoxin subunit
MGQPDWVDLGAVEELRNPPVRTVRVGRLQLAVSYLEGRFGVISNVCNHVGGPLGEGRWTVSMSSAPGTLTSPTSSPYRLTGCGRWA